MVVTFRSTCNLVSLLLGVTVDSPLTVKPYDLYGEKSKMSATEDSPLTVYSPLDLNDLCGWGLEKTHDIILTVYDCIPPYYSLGN
jgi:hypothetical protein